MSARIRSTKKYKALTAVGYSDTEATYYGKPTEARARIYHWHFGQVGVELLQPLGPPSVWQDWLDEHGPSVHHVAFRVTDTDGVAREFARFGYPVTQQGFFTGRFANGGHTGLFRSYVAVAHLGKARSEIDTQIDRDDARSLSVHIPICGFQFD